MRAGKTYMGKTGFITVLTLILLAGCGEEEKIDYTIEGMAQEEQPQSEGGKNGLEQLEEEETWQETWTVKTGEMEWDGRMVDVLTDMHVDAAITLPQAKQMSVIEVMEPEFDAAYKKDIAERLFDSGKIYYDDNTPVGEYTEDEYIGSYEGRLYNLFFVDTTDTPDNRRAKQIIWSVKDMGEVCPEKLKEQEEPQCSIWTKGNWVENHCQVSEEEALKEAKQLVEKLGLDYPVVSVTYPLVWGKVPEYVGTADDTEADTWVVNGYVFSFDLGVDDLSFVEYGIEEDYAEYFMNPVLGKKRYSLNTRLQVYVTDQGIVKMEANSPLEITNISEGVELLPIDTIKEMIKEKMNEEYETFRFDGVETYYNAMELIYFRVRDKENAGKYNYVPAWRLATITREEALNGIDIRHPVLLNAIDGSVIDFYDET